MRPRIPFMATLLLFLSVLAFGQQGGDAEGVGVILVEEGRRRGLPRTEAESQDQVIAAPPNGFGAMRVFRFDGLNANCTDHGALAKWMLLASMQSEPLAPGEERTIPPDRIRRATVDFFWDGTAPMETPSRGHVAARVWSFPLPAPNAGVGQSQSGSAYAVSGLNREGDADTQTAPIVPVLLVERWPFMLERAVPRSAADAVADGFVAGTNYVSYLALAPRLGMPALSGMYLCGSGSLCTSSAGLNPDDWNAIHEVIHSLSIGDNREDDGSMIVPVPAAAISVAESEALAQAVASSTDPAGELDAVRSLLAAHPDWNWVACRALILEIALGQRQPSPQTNPAAEALRLAFVAGTADRKRAIHRFRSPEFEFGPALGAWMATAAEELHRERGVGFVPLMGVVD